jgi:hypothetical protein
MLGISIKRQLSTHAAGVRRDLNVRLPVMAAKTGPTECHRLQS